MAFILSLFINLFSVCFSKTLKIFAKFFITNNSLLYSNILFSNKIHNLLIFSIQDIGITPNFFNKLLSNSPLSPSILFSFNNENSWKLSLSSSKSESYSSSTISFLSLELSSIILYCLLMQ